MFKRLFPSLLALGLCLPARSSPLPARLAVESTSQSSFVLDARGLLHAWEDNQAGQLGIGTQSGTTHSSEATAVTVPFPAGVTRWIDVAAGTFHTLAIADNGQLLGSGANGYKQLGTDNPNGQLSFTPIPPLNGKTNWIGIAAGDHSMALAADGTLYAWGANYNGQLGNGNENNQSTPQIVPLPPGVTRWVQIAAGENHSLSIANTGQLYAWGANFYGQLGNGYNLRQSRPVAVVLPVGVTSWQRVAAGFNFSLALGNNGVVYAWGQNSEGQLGNGTTDNSNVPLAVGLAAGISWTKIAAGGSEGFVISSTGQLYSWGGNYWGECGLGTRGPQLEPVQVLFPGAEGGGWADIAGGRGHTLGLGSDCRVYQWGLRFSQSSPQTTPSWAAELDDLCTGPSNTAPTVSILNPTNGAVIAGPSTVTIQAQANDADGSVSRVDFFDGDHLLGTGQLSGSVYTFTWTPDAGRHLLTARATDNLGLSRNSDPVTVTLINSNLSTVSISVVDGQASEVGPHNGSCLITRSGNSTEPLRVNLSVGGTAINGTDYRGLNYYYLSNFVVIPAGAASYEIGIHPLADNIIEGDETVIFTLLDSPTYNVGASNQAVITIADDPAVEAHPYVSLIAPGQGGTFVAPAQIDLAAVINASSGASASVEFFAGTVRLGASGNASSDLASNLFLFSWQNVPPGSYDLIAQTVNGSGVMVGSPRVHVNVLSPTNVPTMQIARKSVQNQGTQLTIKGKTDGVYMIEYTSDFKNWVPLTTSSSANGIITFTDFQATGVSHRFYRAVLVP